MMEKENLLAVFMDIENAFPEFSGEKLRYVFDYLAGIGEIALCRGYADWGKLANRKKEALEWNVSTINLFTRGEARKNAADIAITVDAMEELYTVKEITTFVIVSGDSDLAPLATKLKEKGREVIGISRKDVASLYLIKACTKFVYLDDLEPSLKKLKGEKPIHSEAIKDTLIQIIKEKLDKNKPVNAGALKRLLLKKETDFNEKKYGFKTFTQFLESLLEFEVVRSATGSVNIKLVEDIEKKKPEEETRIVEEQALPLSLEEAQDILIRAIKSVQRPDGLADPSGLKSTMLRMAPRFSEKSLGYNKFTDFIKDQKDLVKIRRISPGQYIVELLEK